MSQKFCFQVIQKLTKHYDYDVLVGSALTFKLQRTITDLGVCDSFNSQLSAYFAPDFLIGNRLPANEPLYELNYLDINTFILINDLTDCHVSADTKPNQSDAI